MDKIHSFAHDIKLELLDNSYSDDELKYFIKGLLDTAIKSSEGTYLLQILNTDIFQKIMQLFSKYGISFKQKSSTIFEVKYSEEFPENELIFSYYSGVFVSGGSVNSLESQYYHLELKFSDATEAKRSLIFLNNNEFEFTATNRKDKIILYIKKSKVISNFLGAIGAISSMTKFDDILIERDMNNYANRYSNFDTYNSLKMVEANQRFSEMLDWIKQENLTHKFKDYELDFFELKRKNKYDSLDTLKDIYNKKTGEKKTKSALNHWLIKLRNLYEEFN